MAWNSNKVWPLAVMPLIMTSILHANGAVDEVVDETSALISAISKTNANQTAPAPSQPSQKTPSTQSPSKTSTTPAAPSPAAVVSSPRTEVQNGINLFITADLLYWTAREEMKGYVIKDRDITTAIPPGVPNPQPNAKVRNFAHEWNWGCRLGLGYNFRNSFTDLYLNWTHYQQNTTSHSAVTKPGQQQFATWLQFTESLTGAFSQFPESATGKWKLHYNTLDLELGRSLGLGSFVIFRPHLGLRGAIIDQDFDIIYKNLLALRGRKAFSKATIDLDNNFWGIGLRGGINSTWKLGAGFGIYGNLAGSVLWGHMNNKVKQNQFADGDGVWENDRHRRQVVKGNLEVALGLSWDHYFSTAQQQNRYHLGLTLGWEQLIWFHQNEVSRFCTHILTTHSTKEHGNLSLSGVTLGARFDF